MLVLCRKDLCERKHDTRVEIFVSNFTTYRGGRVIKQMVKLPTITIWLFSSGRGGVGICTATLPKTHSSCERPLNTERLPSSSLFVTMIQPKETIHCMHGMVLERYWHPNKKSLLAMTYPFNATKFIQNM